MPKKASKWHGGRAMLNLPGHQTTAAIVAEVQDTGPANASQSRDEHYPFATLQISDCTRSVSFEIEGFRTYSSDFEESMKNDLHKVDTLIKMLTDFRAGLITEQRRFKRRKAR